jgi:hypothetical protein
MVVHALAHQCVQKAGAAAREQRQEVTLQAALAGLHRQALVTCGTAEDVVDTEAAPQTAVEVEAEEQQGQEVMVVLAVQHPAQAAAGAGEQPMGA